MRLSIVVLIGCASIATAPVAQARTILGHGGNSCGRWLEERKSLALPPDLAWITGYVFRASRATGRDLLKEPDAEALVAFVDNYCRANPLDKVADAADALERELIKRTPQTEPPL